MLGLEGVSKFFDGSPALAGIDLHISAGKTTILLGPSGCGKSTLLKLAAGLLWPEAGSIRFEDCPLTRNNAPQLRQKMGYVIQEGGLFPHLTARRNVSLMACHLGWDRERIAGRIEELLTLTRFPPEGLDRYPAQLSGGQRQRVGIMRALMLDPDLLLLDEPLGALDPMIRSELQEDLRAIFRELGKTVLMVTHDLGEADYLGDRIVLMRGGKIVQIGGLTDLFRSPVEPFVSRFLAAQRSPLEGIGEQGA